MGAGGDREVGWVGWGGCRAPGCGDGGGVVVGGAARRVVWCRYDCRGHRGVVLWHGSRGRTGGGSDRFSLADEDRGLCVQIAV